MVTKQIFRAKTTKLHIPYYLIVFGNYVSSSQLQFCPSSCAQTKLNNYNLDLDLTFGTTTEKVRAEVIYFLIISEIMNEVAIRRD